MRLLAARRYRTLRPGSGQRRRSLRKIAYPFLFMLMLVSGCTTLVKEPEVTVKNLKVVSLDGSGAGMELALNVKNMNPYAITMQGYTYDLKVMSLPLAKGDARQEIKFPSLQDTEFRIPIRISFGDLFEILKRKPDPEKVPYQLTAGLDVATPLGQMTVPISHSGTYAIPKKYRPSSLFNKVPDFLKF